MSSPPGSVTPTSHVDTLCCAPLLPTRWLKKGLTKEFLNTCVDICRKCHNVVHRFKDNDTLGKEYNTLEKLLAADYIQRWIAYARSRPAPTREEREAHLKLAK